MYDFSKMVTNRFRVISVSLLLFAHFACLVRCQNLTTKSTCLNGEIGCKPDGDEKKVSNSTGNAPNAAKTSPSPANATDNGRARSMNFTSAFQGDMRSNGLETGTPLSHAPKSNVNEHSIDDVSMDEMEDDYNFTNAISTMHMFNGMMNNLQMVKNASSSCVDRDNVYKLGEKFSRGCDESCQCLKDGIVCSQQCKPPYYVKGRNKNSECVEETVDGNSCCVLLKCTPAVPDLETEPSNGCLYKNVSYKRGSTIMEGCESVCTCEAGGHVSCKSRCPPVQNATENCVALPDKKDPCCTIVLCDVEEHDVNKIGTTIPEEPSVVSSTADNQIITAKAINDSAVALTFAEKAKDCNVELSINGINWENAMCTENVVGGLQPGKKYHFRLKNVASNRVEVTLPSLNQTSLAACSYKGKTYKIGEEFHDGCAAFCICDKTGVECAPIDCPTDFGLDVLDPHCLDWEMYPQDFVPTPPRCCPEKVLCRSNGSCTYNGANFPNWSELPTSVTGCEKVCYCEMGNVTCQQRCPPVPETPPKNLHCPPEQAVLAHPPDDSCCSMWTCPTVGRTGNESISMNKQRNNATLQKTTTDPTTTTKPVTKTNANDFPINVVPKPSTTKNVTSSQFFPGPFSPQYLSENENSTSVVDQKQHKTNHVLTDLLSPFHLEEYAPEIEKELHANETVAVAVDDAADKEKKPKKPIKTYSPFSKDEDDADDHDYDEKNQYEDIFADIFDAKNKHKNATKHPFWTVKPPEIPELVKNPHLHSFGLKPTSKEKEVVAAELPKKHDSYANKKQKPSDDTKKEMEKPVDGFLPYPNIPYAVQNEAYPPNLNPGLKYPPAEILIHHGQNPSVNFANKFKHPPVSDAGQPEDYFHIVDNDAYNDEQIRQNLPYHGGPPDQHPQFGHVVRLNKDGIRVQNPTQQQVNVEDVLTHLHNENNVHLPNIVTGSDQQIPNVIHHFGFPNYHETLNVDQTSHPLLLRPQLVHHDGNDTNREEIKIHVLEAVDESTVRLVFSVPAFLVGLHGRIGLRYTSDQQNNEPSTWELQILAPPNDLIATKELEFELGGLQANTTYKIKISVMMHDIDNAPTSSVLTIKTLPPATPSTTLPPIIPVEPELRIVEANSTYAKVAWRMFNDFEMQFIDGVQLRYKELDDKVYAATPLIHRAVTTYTIEELKPDSVYEVGIFFIPFPGQTTELQAHQTIQIRTSVENDPYKFDVTMDVHHIKSTSVEISWSGVPYPEDKFVHIFRAIYQSEGSREDVSSFKAAKRDSPQSILIQDLKPATRYRLWLEVYLTNGRTKKSNVKDFVTKLGPTSAPFPSQITGKTEGTALEPYSYYGPLVVVSIVAAISITSTVILSLILAKKHGTNKAPITTPINRKNNSSAAYDNPSYKTYENDRNGNNNSKTGPIALSVFSKTHVEKEA